MRRGCGRAPQRWREWRIALQVSEIDEPTIKILYMGFEVGIETFIVRFHSTKIVCVERGITDRNKADDGDGKEDLTQVIKSG